MIFGAVGSTWVDAIGAASGAPAGAQRAGSSALEKDVLFYMYYPYSKRNAVLRPRFDKLAELLWKPKCCGSRPSTLRVGQINAKANELPAPYGLHILKDELVLYPAGAKESPAHLQWDDTEQTPPLLMEMLELLRDQSQNKETSEFVNNIMSHIGEIRLYDPDWYKARRQARRGGGGLRGLRAHAAARRREQAPGVARRRPPSRSSQNGEPSGTCARRTSTTSSRPCT